MCRPEIKALQQPGKRIRDVRQTEAVRKVRGPAGPRLVPGDDGELVGQVGELRRPDAAVVSGAVDEDQGRSLALAPVGDREAGRLDTLLLSNVRG